jgi:hypothetical protein
VKINDRMREPDPLLRVAVLVYALLFEALPLEGYTDTAAACAEPESEVRSGRFRSTTEYFLPTSCSLILLFSHLPVFLSSGLLVFPFLSFVPPIVTDFATFLQQGGSQGYMEWWPGVADELKNFVISLSRINGYSLANLVQFRSGPFIRRANSLRKELTAAVEDFKVRRGAQERADKDKVHMCY